MDTETTLTQRIPLGKILRNAWNTIPQILRTALGDTQRFVFICGIVGILCGLSAVALHLSIAWVWLGAWQFISGLTGWAFWLAAMAIPALGAGIAGFFIKKFAPRATGSGIPQTKAYYYKDFGVIRIQDSIWRFFLGIVYLGSGNCLGREGPTVQMCSGIASWLGQSFGLAKSRIQAMVPIGMGAGIAAAFNAPVAAITFVFEELLGDFSNKALGGMVVALVLASVVERAVFGTHPLFPLGLDIHTPGGWWTLACIPLGVVGAVLGHLFVRTLLNMRGWIHGNMQTIPLWLRLAVSGVIIGLIGAGVYTQTGSNGVFSVGYTTLNEALGSHWGLWALLLLFAGKFIATLICYSAGGSGGLFSPTIFCGGMLGGAAGCVMHTWFGAPAEAIAGMVLLGMGCFVASVIRCPITSVVMVFEMTGQYGLILPLMLGNVIAYALAARWQPDALYDALLLQDGISLRRFPSYQGKQDYRNLPISAIMSYDVLSLKDFQTPRESTEWMQSRTQEAYPIVNGKGELVSIITHDELMHLMETDPDIPLSESHQSGTHLVTVYPDTSIRDTANALVNSDILQAPVVSRADPTRLLGIVTLHDIARQQSAVDLHG